MLDMLNEGATNYEASLSAKEWELSKHVVIYVRHLKTNCSIAAENIVLRQRSHTPILLVVANNLNYQQLAISCNK